MWYLLSLFFIGFRKFASYRAVTVTELWLADFLNPMKDRLRKGVAFPWKWKAPQLVHWRLADWRALGQYSRLEASMLEASRSKARRPGCRLEASRPRCWLDASRLGSRLEASRLVRLLEASGLAIAGRQGYRAGRNKIQALLKWNSYGIRLYGIWNESQEERNCSEVWGYVICDVQHWRRYDRQSELSEVRMKV